MLVYHLIYRSMASQELREAQLLALLTWSRTYNEAQDITGILLRGPGHYLQVLEGKEAAITKLYASIRADKRHSGVAVLADGSSGSRIFPRWRMGFLEASAKDFARLEGHIDPVYRSPWPPHGNVLARGYLALLQEFATAQPVRF